MSYKTATRPNLYKTWYVGVFEITGYESEVQIIKFKMADEN